MLINESRRRLCLAIVLIVSVLFVIMMLFHNEEVVGTPIPPEPFMLAAKPRLDRSVEIAIVIVLSKGSDASNYRSALNSVDAYSALHGYRLHIVNDEKYEECARHSDKFFRRHCHTHQMMINELPDDSWVLFIDADVGVVNPNRLIEHFIEPEYDIYLYNRFYNWEFAAQYLVRNNGRGRDWVKKWSQMEFTLSNSFHGTDNGALHMLMMHYLVPETVQGGSRIGLLCKSIWERSVNSHDLFTMEACTRMVIGERSDFPQQHVKIFAKGLGWARDIWLLRSRWSLDDFMLHSIKEERLKPDVIAAQKPPKPDQHYDLIFSEVDKFNDPLAFPVLNITRLENGQQRWIMDARFRISSYLRAKLFHRMTITKWKEQFGHFAKHISKFLN